MILSASECRSHLLATVLLCVFFVCFTYTHQVGYKTFTPASRLALLHAVVEDHTLSIDRWHEQTTDKAEHHGRFYSDKAPGTAAFALPAFWLASSVMKRLGYSSSSNKTWFVTSWVACAWSQAFPAALGGALLFLWLTKQVPVRAAAITVIVLWLGSLPLPYSTMLFSHAQVIGLLGITIWAIDLFTPDAAPSKRRLALAGLCIGLVLASEYTAAVIAIPLMLYVGCKRRAGLLFFVVACSLPVLLVPAYSMATIGSPFHLPYEYHSSFPGMHTGLFGIRLPNLENLGRLLFGPTRGLLFWTPFLFLAIAGAYRMTSTRPSRLWLTGLLPLIHCIIISGYYDWRAGYTLSARYLSPILPLLALPCAIGVTRYPRLGILTGIVSIVMVTLATLICATPDYSFGNPLVELIIPRLKAGDINYTVASLFGVSPFVAMFCFYCILCSSMFLFWRLMTDDRNKPA